MNYGYQNLFEGSEKHQKLLAVMQEFGLVQGGNIPYREAVIKYYNWLNSGIKPLVYKPFGEYSFRVNDYELLTDRELELVCDIFRSYKPKRLFSGVKMYRRQFSTACFYKKEKACLLKPGDIIWEVSGLDMNTVIQMARQASQTIGINIVVCNAAGNYV